MSQRKAVPVICFNLISLPFPSIKCLIINPNKPSSFVNLISCEHRLQDTRCVCLYLIIFLSRSTFNRDELTCLRQDDNRVVTMDVTLSYFLYLTPTQVLHRHKYWQDTETNKHSTELLFRKELEASPGRNHSSTKCPKVRPKLQKCSSVQN